MIECSGIRKPQIRLHYDLSTFFYRWMWGIHIHHGYWEGDETPARAQVQLTERLAERAGLGRGKRVIDVGCGMGGSSQWMAKERGCEVTGVTLSPVQRRWAQWSALIHGVRPRPKFLRADAEALEREPGSLDLVWSVECTEHLFDKAKFFQKAATWLKPGGRVAICAWLAGNDETNPEVKRQVVEVCEGMLCPSLGTQADYCGWLTDAGLRMVHNEIWTQEVLQTWEICKQRVEKTRVRWLARLLGQDHVLFLDRFDAILNAYRTRAMEYGCFVAERPE